MFKACRSSIIEMINRQCDKINMFNSHYSSGGRTGVAASSTRMNPNCCGSASSGGCGHVVSPTLGKTYLVSINRCKSSGGDAATHKQTYSGQGKVISSSRKLTSRMNDEQSRHSPLHNGSTSKNSWTGMQEFYPAGTKCIKLIYVQFAQKESMLTDTTVFISLS